MDLDETVLDNAGFETWLYKNRLAYAEPLWDPWERDFPHEVQLVPGAKQFIGAAELAGVTVVYLSNRSTRFRDSTVKALALNGLNTDGLDERLLLKDNGSDKTGRRAQAEQRFRVLLYFGDNLRDFDEAFKVTSGQTTFESRARLVDRAAHHWGADWFVLPNPSYGEWERLLGPRPQEKLRPTLMPPPAVAP